MSLATWIPRLVVGLLALSLTGNPGVTGPVPSFTLLAGALALPLAAILLWQRGLHPPPKVSIMAVLLACCGLFSVLVSTAPYLSSLGVASLAGFVAVVVGLELGISSRHKWREVAGALVIVAVVSAMYGLRQWQLAAGAGALKSTFTNPDCYSLILILATFLALGLAVELSGLARLCWVLALIPLVSALLLTASRAGLLGLATGYLGYLFTLGCSRSEQLRTLSFKLVLPPTLILLFVMGGGTQLQVVQRLSSLSRGEDPVTIKSRWDVIRYGYKTVARRPLTGSGLGCFHLAYQRDRPPLAAGEDYMNVAHNDYMQWLVETGVPGGLCWMGLLFTGLIVSWRSYRSPTPWVAAQIGSTVGVATYCIFNFACPVPADLLWIGASLGLSGSLPRLNLEGHRSSWNPKVFPIAVFLVAWGAWSASWSFSCLTIQRAERDVAQAEAVLDWGGAIMRLESAARSQPQNFNLQLKLAELSKKAFVFTGTDHWLDRQGQALQKAYQSNPSDLRILLTQIRFLQDQLQPTLATKYIELAEGLAPYSPYVRRAKARNQILLGKLTDAAATLSAIERSGQPIDDGALAALIYLLESKSPDKGAAFLRRVAGTNIDRAADLGIQAASAASKSQDFATALRLLKPLRYLAPKRPEVLLEIAFARGAAGHKDQELDTLNKIRRNSDLELDDALLEKVWRRWAELQVEQGELDLVITQLEDYLITHQRQSWPRTMMAQIYLKREQKAEARAALREGIPYDDDGSLRIQLGDMCASQGLTQLARSYYREAMAVSPQRALIEQRLKAMKSSPDDELEEE